jgi:hypothetical protein
MATHSYEQCLELFGGLRVKWKEHFQSPLGNGSIFTGKCSLGRSKSILWHCVFPDNPDANYFRVWLPGRRLEVLVFAEPSLHNSADEVSDNAEEAIRAFLRARLG